MVKMNKMSSFVISLILFGVQSFVWGQSRGPGPTLRAAVVGHLSEPITNCAVSFFTKDGNDYLYVFGGLDSTLDKTGIHKRCFRFDLETGQTMRLPNLPDSAGKLAASATRIGDKIYVIGGYYVNANGSETTSNKVHVFDPIGDTFKLDARPLPIPVDDHVQFSYRDSLIYCITGWSDGKNITNVQVFDPNSNSWFQATAIPDILNYKSFGATGGLYDENGLIRIIGGASDIGQFPGIRKIIYGRISPHDPSKINWNSQTFLLSQTLYRSLMTPSGMIIGGAENTYNYNAVAYDGSGIVNPRELYSGKFWEDSVTRYVPMDLRDWGIKSHGSYGDTCFSIGGILHNQEVTNLVVRYTTLLAGGANENLTNIKSLKLYPNPIKQNLNIRSQKGGLLQLELLDVNGKILRKIVFDVEAQLDFSIYPKGIYLLRNPSDGESHKIIKQ